MLCNLVITLESSGLYTSLILL